MEKNRSILKEILVPIILVVVFITAVLSVVMYQSNNQPPKLSVSIPEASATSNSNINILGKTDKGAKVTIDNTKVNVDKNGNFSFTYTLRQGKNNIIFKAKKGSSKTTTLTREVTREIPAVPVATVQTTPKPIVNGRLATSGPDQNIGIFGLAGIMGSLLLYRKTKKKNQSQIAAFETFTDTTI